MPNAPPALLTRTWRESPTTSASAATESAEVTSQVTAVPSILRASSSIRSDLRAAQTTANPSWARARAVAAPIPLEAPVTTAVRRLMGTILPGRVSGRVSGWHTVAPMGRHVDAAGASTGVRRTALVCGLLGGLAWVATYFVDTDTNLAKVLL